MLDLEKHLLSINPKARWAIIITVFCIIGILDFSTPPEYILAYLYIIPILLSISFLKPKIAKTLLVLAVFLTLTNLVFPDYVLDRPGIVISRLLAALAIVISAFFMVRYIRYQHRMQEQDMLLTTEQNLALVREDFIATLTHDLKTPLLGEQETLKHFLKETFGSVSQGQKEALEVLQRSNKRQLELVNNLVSAYRNDNFGVELSLSELNMDELIADILIEVQYLASERGITMSYTCDRTPPSIKGDAFQLKRVLANLIHNALNYTPSGGSIQIRLTEQHGQLLTEIADTGPGMNPNDLENVFTRFYQSGEARQIVSTGLGLYLSRQIILAHRGSIWAENRKPHGCQFSFTLPL